MKAAHTHCCGRVRLEIVYNHYNGKIPNTDTDVKYRHRHTTNTSSNVENNFHMKYGRSSRFLNMLMEVAVALSLAACWMFCSKTSRNWQHIHWRMERLLTVRFLFGGPCSIVWFVSHSKLHHKPYSFCWGLRWAVPSPSEWVTVVFTVAHKIAPILLTYRRTGTKVYWTFESFV